MNTAYFLLYIDHSTRRILGSGIYSEPSPTVADLTGARYSRPIMTVTRSEYHLAASSLRRAIMREMLLPTELGRLLRRLKRAHLLCDRTRSIPALRPGTVLYGQAAR